MTVSNYKKSNRVTINQTLQSKSSKWEFSDGMWQYDDGLKATFIRKTNGDLNNSEIIVITNNNSIMNTFVDDIKNNGMIQDGNKAAFIGKNYVVLFITKTNKFGEKIYSIHIMPKSMY
ncbi:MAG: hypothetical protein WKF85_14625 [Chitinophagaceae bacterium]